MSKSLSISVYLRTERARVAAGHSGNSRITDFTADSDGRVAREVRGAYTIDELKAVLQDLELVQADYDKARTIFTDDLIAKPESEQYIVVTGGGHFWNATTEKAVTLLADAKRYTERDATWCLTYLSGGSAVFSVENYLKSLDPSVDSPTSKTPTFIEHKYRVSAHFVCALINGDYSALDSRECATLNNWIKTETQGKPGHWANLDDSDEFGFCDVTGAHGAVESMAFMEISR